MAKFSSSADGLYRSGSISSTQWAKLHPNEHGGGKGSQKSKMAKFEEKTKNEGAGKLRGAAAATRRHIDTHQEMGKPSHGGGKPSHGGAVGGSHKSPTTRAINENQKPLFPHQGGGSPRKTLSKQQPSSSQPVGPQYGGPSGRAEKPARL